MASTSTATVLAYPVAATTLASYGRESEALAEQGLFLREYLARVPPESLARLSLPAGVLLRQVGVASSTTISRASCAARPR